TSNWGFWNPNQSANWRSTGTGSAMVNGLRLFGGSYNCLDCGGQHTLPGIGTAGLGRALVCLALPAGEALKRARGRVQHLLARAEGQFDYTATMLYTQAAEEITIWSICHPEWGADIKAEFIHDARLRPLLIRDDLFPGFTTANGRFEDIYRNDQMGHNSRVP